MSGAWFEQFAALATSKWPPIADALNQNEHFDIYFNICWWFLPSQCSNSICLDLCWIWIWDSLSMFRHWRTGTRTVHGRFVEVAVRQSLAQRWQVWSPFRVPPAYLLQKRDRKIHGSMMSMFVKINGAYWALNLFMWGLPRHKDLRAKAPKCLGRWQWSMHQLTHAWINMQT